MKQEKFLLHCDNQSVIHLAKNVIYHSRTKHIQRKYHWLRQRVNENEFVLAKIHTDDNGSDMITKILMGESAEEHTHIYIYMCVLQLTYYCLYYRSPARK